MRKKIGLFIISNIQPIVIFIMAVIIYFIYNYYSHQHDYYQRKWMSEVLAEEFEGIIVDMFQTKAVVLQIFTKDTTITRGVTMELAIIAEIGDSIYKLKGLDECIVVDSKSKKRYLIPYYTNHRLVSGDSIRFPGDKEILKKYPDMKVVVMGDKELMDRFNAKKFKRK